MPIISTNGPTLELHSPTAMPLASSFLWNKQMMIQVNCRGYATAQFMQPEPAKYAHAPNLEAKSFMQPEQPYFAHHPGRFFYIKDTQTNAMFSAPYEPMRQTLDDFKFIAGQTFIGWDITHNGVNLEIRLSLTHDKPCELWEVKVTNVSDRKRTLSLVPYFPVGYMSWMNQSAQYEPILQSIVCHSITPYQKFADYFKNKHFKDLTYFIADHAPNSWDARQIAFEGEGGLHMPDGMSRSRLSNSTALYETPAAVMQFSLSLDKNESKIYRFGFGAAENHEEIKKIKQTLFANAAQFSEAIAQYEQTISQAQPALKITTPDPELDCFVNYWLTRQVYYHGDVNRLSTDPQTRNYLQDNMGMSYVKPNVARAAFLNALSQQHISGAMPDGILLMDGAQLKYINQVPHMDHCVWLPICLSAYLDETNDYAILDEVVGFAQNDTDNESSKTKYHKTASVCEHIDMAMDWLYQKRDHRGLSFIEQGDWCDPMNMVGYKGRGVSGWLTLALAYALNTWSEISEKNNRSEQVKRFSEFAAQCNQAVNTYLWDGDWYARGITDDDVTFGTSEDDEGKIFLNPQSWAILSGAAQGKETRLLDAVEAHLHTPYGVEMLAPSFTKMREDIGRVTQKHPGSGENGSIYNHAAAFYVYALYRINQGDRAYEALRKMIPGPSEKDILRRGQLPTFIPNYYRGAYKQFERTAGRSSQLFNTGTVHWFYRSLIDGLFGVKGEKEGLRINPQLPTNWSEAVVERVFRGAVFEIHIKRDKQLSKLALLVDGELQESNLISDIEINRRYKLAVSVP